MRTKIVLILVLLIFISGAGIGCDSSKASKITGPVSAGTPSYAGNALDIWSDQSKIGVGDTTTITTKIFNTGGYALSGGGDCNTTGTATTISVIYSINTHGTLSASSSSATLTGSTTTTCPQTASEYYFYITLTGATRGTAEIIATHFDMQKTIYVDIE